MMMDFSFITYAAMPELDPDDRLAFDILTQRGARTQAVVWDDPGVDWARAGTCIIRSTWDYNLRHEAFLQWSERVAALTPLWNPPSLIRWNTTKTYLQDLQRAGVATVPTRWITRGTRPHLRDVLRDFGWHTAVLKPAVGLSTYGVKKVSTHNGSASEAQGHLEKLLADHDVMVQPYIPSVEDYGERALVFIAGRYSHAVRKTAFQALLPAGEAGETPARATPAEIAAAQGAMDALPEPALYARVDLVQDEHAEPLVIELEVVEPTLFLSMDPQAPQRFADAVLALRA